MNPIIEGVRRLGLAHPIFDDLDDQSWNDLIDCYIFYDQQLPESMMELLLKMDSVT